MKKMKRKRTTADSSIKDRKSVVSCHFHHFTVTEMSEIRAALLGWYDQNKRQLPWRESAIHPDTNVRSYSVWVSEVMAQQTQIATVISYYNRWMRKWPTVADLAKAKLDEVNKLWSGLGYYSRAKRLLEGAHVIDKQLNGQIPQNSVELQKLPGVGRYTACAISSIAFGEVKGVVDGNVVRVLTRLRAVGSETNNSMINDWLWQCVDQMIDKCRPGDFNQSLMELGALVCTPKSPSCVTCPVQSYCLAYKQNVNQQSHNTHLLSNDVCKLEKQSVMDLESLPNCQFCLPTNKYEPSLGVENFPQRSKMKTKREERIVVAVLYRVCADTNSLEYFIVQRPSKGLLANLWEFPNILVDSNISDETRRSLLIDSLKKRFGRLPKLNTDGLHYKGQVLHIFSHIRCFYDVYDVEVKGKFVCKATQPFLWVTKMELQKSAISTAMRKVFKLQEKT